MATSNLTERQKFALSQILEVPYADQSHRVVGDGINAIDQLAQVGADQAWTGIQARLDEIAATADLESELQDLLDSYYNLGTNVTRIEAGSIGSIGGVHDDPDQERELIRRRVLIIVPFYRRHEEFQAKARGGGGLVPFVH